MKKIAILKRDPGRLGGLEKYTRRIAEVFRKRNHPVTLVTTGEFEALYGIDIAAHQLSSRWGFNKIKEFDGFCNHYLRNNPHEIIFGMDRNSFQTHLRAGNGVHAAYLDLRKKSEGFLKSMTFPFNPLHHTLLNIEKRSFEHPDLQLLLVNSYMVREQVLKFYSTDPEKVRVVHNGVEWSEMSEDFASWPEKRKQVAADLNLDPNLYHFLFIGHNFQRKGLKKLLYALANISRKDFHLSVIGEDKNFGLFRKHVEHLNLAGKVTFFGSRSDIRSFYQMADALVIPSFYDPFANVTVEALAMGLFVVSSQTNGGHEILSSDNGTVIESLEDTDSFVDALEKALKAPKTWEQSNLIRQSVQHLDFPNQLNLLCDLCLS